MTEQQFQSNFPAVANYINRMLATAGINKTFVFGECSENYGDPLNRYAIYWNASNENEALFCEFNVQTQVISQCSIDED